MAIVQRCEEKYGYKMFHHQRVIVEHIKDGRQHFHVIWNRVSLYTGRPVWPGHHWKKSKQICREMEKELGLKRPTSRRSKGSFTQSKRKGAAGRTARRYQTKKALHKQAIPKARLGMPPLLIQSLRAMASKNSASYIPIAKGRKRRKSENKPDSEKMPFRRPEWDSAELLAWAWENGRLDVLAQFGIILPPDYFEP